MSLKVFVIAIPKEDLAGIILAVIPGVTVLVTYRNKKSFFLYDIEEELKKTHFCGTSKSYTVLFGK